MMKMASRTVAVISEANQNDRDALVRPVAMTMRSAALIADYEREAHSFGRPVLSHHWRGERPRPGGRQSAVGLVRVLAKRNMKFTPSCTENKI